MESKMLTLKKHSHPLWSDIQDEPLFSSFADALAKTLPLEPATFAELNSCCIDIPALSQNAVRQELSDMFSMYRAMADLGSELTVDDVKNSTLWFRTFSKFLKQNVISWHEEELFPWVFAKVNLERGRHVEIEILLKARKEIEEHSSIVYAKQARLSAEISGQGRASLLRVQFVDGVCGAVELAEKLVQYFRSVESIIAPLLQEAGTIPEERDELFQKMVLKMIENGSQRIDLPILVRWMPRMIIKEWLSRCALDHRGRAISISSFNRWLRDYLGENHVNTVLAIVRKAEAA